MRIGIAFLVMCALVLSFTSCNNDDKKNAPEFKSVTYTPTADDQKIGEGNFVTDPPREVSGKAIVYKNNIHQVLRFENFMVDNGPDLKVYLAISKDDISNHINLGSLIAASGNFNYTFSVNTDVAAYRYVLVYSEENNSVYCYAEI